MLKKTFLALSMCVLAAAAAGVSTAGDTTTNAPATATAPEYYLGNGDRIHVNVFDEPDLSGDFTVTGDGYISLPLIGQVQATGLTVTQLKAAIEYAYMQGFLKDPKVNVEVADFRPFYILGEVGKPGEYPYSDGITVLNAVALAEGFTYRAQKKKVYIRHINEDKETPVPLTSSLQVAPGDTIRIGERYF